MFKFYRYEIVLALIFATQFIVTTVALVAGPGSGQVF